MVRRFRTLSGCLTCRARRKKCDEIKPCCTLCSRLGIRCAWGTAEEDHSATVKVVRENLAENNRDCELLAQQCQTPLCDQQLEVEFEFVAQCSSWIASTLSPLALAQWRSSERLTTELQDCRVAREAIFAFAADITSCGSDHKHPHELQLSSKALARVRMGVMRFANGNLDEESLPTLIISIFLLAFTEIFGKGDCHTAYNHSQALLRMLCRSRKQTVIEETARFPLLFKLAFETAVLGTSTMALFQNQTVVGMSSEDCERLNVVHQRYYQGVRHDTDIYTSPLLQGHTELFVILLRLVHVARMDCSTEKQELLSGIDQQLSICEVESELDAHPHLAITPTQHSWTTLWRYVVTVLRIYLTSLQHPNLCSNSQPIFKKATQGMQQARRIWNLTDNGTFAWPSPFEAPGIGLSRNLAGCTLAFILACAVNNTQALEEIVFRLNKARGCMSPLHHKNLSRLLDIMVLRSTGATGPCTAHLTGTCQGRHDGLDLLRLSLGPFEILDDT